MQNAYATQVYKQYITYVYMQFLAKYIRYSYLAFRFGCGESRISSPLGGYSRTNREIFENCECCICWPDSHVGVSSMRLQSVEKNTNFFLNVMTILWQQRMFISFNQENAEKPGTQVHTGTVNITKKHTTSR